MSKAIQDSLQMIKQTQMEVNKSLGETDYRGNLLEINSLFQRLIARLVFMGGVENPDAPKPESKAQPMTRFMGQDIKRDNTPAADLNPGEAEKQKFLAKVDKLYGAIQHMDTNTILNSYTIHDDVMVLRGVAKRAGVKDFESRALTTEFIEEIQSGIAAKNEEAKLQAGIDATAKKGNEVTVTQDMIDSSKFLQKEKVKPGDKVLQMADGKYKLLQPA